MHMYMCMCMHTRQALLRALLPEGVDNLLFSPEKKGEENSGLKLVPGIAERVRGRCWCACAAVVTEAPLAPCHVAGAGGVGHRRGRPAQL